jgi:hypothetical protein
MGITITLCAFALLATWAILRTLGGERQRRIQELIASRRPPPAAPPPAPPPQAQSPTKSAWRKAA